MVIICFLKSPCSVELREFNLRSHNPSSVPVKIHWKIRTIWKKKFSRIQISIYKNKKIKWIFNQIFDKRKKIDIGQENSKLFVNYFLVNSEFYSCFFSPPHWKPFWIMKVGLCNRFGCENGRNGTPGNEIYLCLAENGLAICADSVHFVSLSPGAFHIWPFSAFHKHILWYL